MKKPFLSTNLAFSAFTTKFVVVHDSSNSSKIKYLLYIFFLEARDEPFVFLLHGFGLSNGLSQDNNAAYYLIAHTNEFNLLSGKVVEYDKPMKLMETEGSLFRELVKEYWSYTSNGNI